MKYLQESNSVDVNAQALQFEVWHTSCQKFNNFTLPILWQGRRFTSRSCIAVAHPSLFSLFLAAAAAAATYISEEENCILNVWP